MIIKLLIEEFVNVRFDPRIDNFFVWVVSGELIELESISYIRVFSRLQGNPLIPFFFKKRHFILSL